MRLTDEIHNSLAHLLVHAARNGTHTIPESLADDYAELERLIDEGKEVTSGGYLKWISIEAEQKAEKVATKLTRLSNYGGSKGIITGHLQPALDDFLDDFRAAWATAGRWADSHGPAMDMLSEPDDVRAAILQLHATPLRYGSIRRSWLELRGGVTIIGSYGATRGGDPMGTHSPLAECRNIADLVPNWQTAGRQGGDAWPWGGGPDHVRLGWLLANGGEIWMPTSDEQDQRYLQIHDASTAARYQPNHQRTMARIEAGTSAA